MPAGRPLSLTAEVQATIVEALESGHYRETAASLAGISRRTFYNWVERGETGEAPFAEFLHTIQRAEAEAENRLLKQIMEAQPAVVGAQGADLWQAKAWVMERRWPSRWSGRVRVTVNEELVGLLERLRGALDAETFAKVERATRQDDPAGAEARH